MTARTGDWSGALAAAATPRPATEWRLRLSRLARRAAGGNFATVFTCPPGDWFHLQQDVDPPELRWVVERIHAEYLPRIQRAGEDWRFALERHGQTYLPLETARARPLADELRREVIAPAGIDGYVTSFIVGAGGRLLGAIVVGAPAPPQRFFDRVRGPMTGLAQQCARTLEAALELAAGCAPRREAGPAATAPLTHRERQIAALAVTGHSNLNISARLGISEQTVHVHLRRIYGKLRVHSRTELAHVLYSQPARS